jgi:aminotransferase
MAKNYLSQRVIQLKPSGIRKFFDIAATMKEVISLGIGEPDFASPQPIIQAGIDALNDHQTHYTANKGIIELRRAVCAHLEKMYGASYDPQEEIVVTVGGSEALLLAIQALLDPAMK